jgi:hypothetical protein
MDYNPKYKYQDEDIYCNDIFTIDNYNKIEVEKSKWKYNKEKFKWGMENKRLFPSLMIYLILATFKYKQIISLDEYEQVVSERYKLNSSSLPYTDQQILIGRAYQTYTSYLREIDVVQKIILTFPQSNIWKNPYLDICSGIDLKVEVDNKMKYVAIKHEGHISDKYDRLWKNEKEANSIHDIIRVTAKHDVKGTGIELVDLNEIRKLKEDVV